MLNYPENLMKEDKSLNTVGLPQYNGRNWYLHEIR